MIHAGAAEFTEHGGAADPSQGSAGINGVGRASAGVGAGASVDGYAGEPVGIGGGPVLVGVLAEVARVEVGGTVTKVPGSPGSRRARWTRRTS